MALKGQHSLSFFGEAGSTAVLASVLAAVDWMCRSGIDGYGLDLHFSPVGAWLTST